MLKRILLSLFLSGFIYSSDLNAEIIVASSASQADVKEAVDLAETGDTIIVPAGEATWSSSVILHKEITIQGAGIDRTIITNAYPTDYQGVLAIDINSDTSETTRITGFTFKSDRVNKSQYHLLINGDREYRVDNCKFKDGYGYLSKSIYIIGYETWGVIDNCIFDGDALEMIGVLATNQTWEEASSLGSERATYIENCLFINSFGGHAFTSIGGAKVVFRYNEVHGADLDMHGHCFVEGRNGARYSEIYENDLYTKPAGYYYAMNIRGGTGVIYNNRLWVVAEGHFLNPAISLTDYRATRECPNDGCGSLSEGGEGYPLYDQVGRGRNQTSEPLYLWNNRTDSNKDGSLDRDSYVGVISVDNPPKAGTQKASDFIKNVPHDGETNPDYYDDGTRPTNYSAFQYPHPLRSKNPIQVLPPELLTVSEGE